jgi:hypothetical protein
MVTNAHNLTRHIPEKTKLEIRQECGFGCVICGSTIVEYEHFDPDFKDAVEHLSAGIALLCPSHHSEVTKGILPKEQIAAARKAPASLQEGFAKEDHPYFNGIPRLDLGTGLILENVLIPVMIKGEPVVSFSPGVGGEITKISMKFEDSSGDNVLDVVDNEWMVMSDVWDFQNVGNRYIIRCKDRMSEIELHFFAPNRILISRAHIFIGGNPLVIDDDGLRFGSTIHQNSSINGAHCAFHFA